MNRALRFVLFLALVQWFQAGLRLENLGFRVLGVWRLWGLGFYGLGSRGLEILAVGF